MLWGCKDASGYVCMCDRKYNMWNEAFNCSGEAQERVYPFRLVNSVRILSSSWRIIEMANELLRAVVV